MRLDGLRRVTITLQLRLPPVLRTAVKRSFQHDRRRRPREVLPLPVAASWRQAPWRATAWPGAEEVVARLAQVGDLPLWLALEPGPVPVPGASRRPPPTRGGDHAPSGTGADHPPAVSRPAVPPDVCLVAAGDLDAALPALTVCERTGVPTVCVVDDEGSATSEIAGSVAAIAVTSAPIVATAARVVPAERVTLTPAAVPTRGLPATGLPSVASPPRRRVLIVAGGDPPPGDLPFTRVAPSLAGRELAGLAAQAIAVVCPPPGRPEVVATAAALAACAVPVVGTPAPDHPLHPLVTAVASHLLPAEPADALRRLATDTGGARVAAVRSRRYALEELSAVAFLRRVLAVADVPLRSSSVSVVSVVDDPASLARLRTSLARQRLVPADVVVGAPRGGHAAVRANLGSLPFPVRLVPVTGPSLRRAAAAATGRYLAVLDATTIYGPDHLGDLRRGLETSGAAIVGRAAHYRLGTEDRVPHVCDPRDEERLVDRLVPGSCLIPRELARRLGSGPLAAAEANLQAWVRRAGGRLYAIHPFGQLVSPGRAGSRSARVELPAIDLAEVFPEGDGGVPFTSPDAN
jgi:hypothetical protein